MQLLQHGVRVGEEGDTIDNPELLMEVMEAREQLEEASSDEELQRMQQDYAHKEHSCVQVWVMEVLLRAARAPGQLSLWLCRQQESGTHCLKQTATGGFVRPTRLSQWPLPPH